MSKRRSSQSLEDLPFQTSQKKYRQEQQDDTLARMAETFRLQQEKRKYRARIEKQKERQRIPQKRSRSVNPQAQVSSQPKAQKAARTAPQEVATFSVPKTAPLNIGAESQQLSDEQSSQLEWNIALWTIRAMFEEEFKEEAAFMKFEEFQWWLGKYFPKVDIFMLAKNSDQLMGAFEQFYRARTEKGTEGAHLYAWGEKRMPFVGFPSINKEGAERLRIADEFQAPSGLNVSPRVNVLFTDHFNKGFTVINGRVVKQYDLPDGSVYFKVESPLGKFTAHESQITFRVLEEDEPSETIAESAPKVLEGVHPDDHDLRASIVKRDIRRRIDEGVDTVDLAANFSEWIEQYQLLYMRFSDLGTSSAKIVFGINPDYEVKLTGTQVEMRMAGTDVPGTSAKRSTDNAPTVDKGRFNTRVQWLGDNLTINGKTNRVGKAMHAFPISQDHQKGSDTSANKKVQEDIMGEMPTGTAITGKENRYIKGHLLNANIGGPASDENLFPITDKANGQHLNTVEAYIKTAVDAGYVCEYKLEVKNISAPVANSAGLYTVDADFDFDFTRLDTSLKQIPKTRHTGVIHSRYGNKPAADYTSGLTDSSKDRKTEFKDDYTGGSVNKPQHPSGSTATAGELKMSNRQDASQNVGDTPGGQGVSAQVGKAPSTGFTFAFPPNMTTKVGTSPAVTKPAVPNLGMISLGGGVPIVAIVPQSIKTPVPAPKSTSGNISLFKSTQADVEKYLQAAVNGWQLADIQAWIVALRTTSYGKWDDILTHVPPTNLDTAVATALFKHMQKTAGITIKGKP